MSPKHIAPTEPGPVDEAADRMIPNWVVSVALLTFVAGGLYLVFTPTEVALASDSASGTASVGQEPLSADTQRTEFKRSRWAPPAPSRNQPSSDSGSSRTRAGLLYSDLREALSQGLNSELVRVERAEQLEFNELRRRLEVAGALENFLVIAEERTDTTRVVRVLTQGTPELIGRLELIREDGRWHIRSVLDVQPE
ncbi:MAG: hypothetical protein AAF488_18290 [Planctomycetota bacterium]